MVLPPQFSAGLLPPCAACDPIDLRTTVATPALLCAARGGSVTSGLTEVLGYGANLDCRKLGALGIEPALAYVASATGYCLDFVEVEGSRLNTSAAEPAFATLLPCTGGCTAGTVLALNDTELGLLRASEIGYVSQMLPHPGRWKLGVES